MLEPLVLPHPFGDDAATLRPAWDALLALEPHPTPFMRWDYLAALDRSGSATPQTGWQPVGFLLQDRSRAPLAACLLYIKGHSFGEYVFDWAWAEAHHRHGVPYYPKAVIAVPFTPVPGPRLLAVSAAPRRALAQAVQRWCSAQGLSSLHLLLGNAADQAAARSAGWMARDGLQFHWSNRQPQCYRSFDDFLACLNQDKRKKIRQERRKVAAAGVRFRTRVGSAITPAEWDFFYRCHQQTYAEHGGRAPYLTREFFAWQAERMAPHWVMFIAELQGRDIACSLIAVDGDASSAQTAYGRYWGALERVHSLHFEAAYYQPIEWCIEHGIARFEGGAQGEHKMARALLPTPTASSHWLAHPAFADAVGDFLQRESAALAHYEAELNARSPLRHTDGATSG